MTIDEIATPGNYLYSRPGWSSPSRVKVYRVIDRKYSIIGIEPGDLVVEFHPGYYPEKVSNCPPDALFEPAQE